MNDPVIILSAEYYGEAKIEDGILNVGGLEIIMNAPGEDYWRRGTCSVYVRRVSDTLSVMEVAIAHHDGLAQEELDQENFEAERYPLGPKEYWRSKMVGKYTYGLDHHLMTDEEFEEDFGEFD